MDDPQDLVLLGSIRAASTRPFESDLKAPASEVYLHEMPGGQFTNLKEQARSLGLEIAGTKSPRPMHEVNQMFGDIVKVTPSSKVVGDMALMMVSQDLRSTM
jgi:pyruvate carboxylase